MRLSSQDKPSNPLNRRSTAFRVAILAAGALALVAGCAGRNRVDLSVWAAGPREQVLPTSSPPARKDAFFDPASGTLRLRAAINETVSFQVALRAGPRDLRNVDVRMETFRSESGAPLRGTIRLFRAWPVQVRAFRTWQSLYRGDDCEPREVYDILVPADAPEGGLPGVIPADTTALIWVDLHVDKGSEPGTYVGPLKILLNEREAWQLNAVLEVEPFALPDQPALMAIARFDARELCRRHLRLKGRAYAPVRLSRYSPLAEQATELIRTTAQMLQEHGVTGVPIGYEPPLHVDGDGRVKIDWQDYDRLVQPLIDGSAFETRVRPAAWPLPIDAAQPPLPREKQLSRQMYQSLLRQSTALAAEHFRLRRWNSLVYVEVDPASEWPRQYAAWQRIIYPPVQQADPQVRMLMRLPCAGLDTYGWPNWPQSDDLIAAAGVLAVPGKFYLLNQAQQLRAQGKQVWLRPDEPPFSPTLLLGASGTDPAAVAWAAWRLKADALELPVQRDWPASQEVVIDKPDKTSDAWLLWPGSPWGLRRPIPSIRLKRLRMGLQECKYLFLLRQHGRGHMDELLAESLVPLAGSLAFGRYYAEGLTGEVVTEPALWHAAKRLMAEELQRAMVGGGSDEFAQFANRVAWRTFLQKTRTIRAWAEPVRLYAEADGSLMAQVPVEILNLRPEPVRGKLRWASLPRQWQPQAAQVTFGPLRPFERTQVILTASGPGMGTDQGGHAQWTVSLEPEHAKPLEIRATVSVAAAVRLKSPITIDGDLADWPAGRFNVLADFALLGERRQTDGGRSRSARMPTAAFVASDGKDLYIAATMKDRPEKIRISQSNAVRYDGTAPLGEDLIEILVDPDNGKGGGPERLIHIVVKANGAALAERGVSIWPPICRARPLEVPVRAATKINRDGWTAEVAVPMHAIQAIRPKRVYWGFNVARLRAANLEYSSWSGARRSVYHPRCLGNLMVPAQQREP